MRHTEALKLVPKPSPHPLDGKPVLESAPLRRGHKRSALSRFEDATWDLSPAVFRENARVCHVTAHFNGIEDASVELILREFLYARLNFDVPGYRMRLPPASVRQLFNRTRRFLEFIAERLGTCDLARVDQALLDAYCVHLSSAPQRRSIQVAHLLELIPDLHRFREHMPSGGLQLLPWKGRSAYIVAGSKQTVGENKTPRLPEEIISPLLQWALKYIDAQADPAEHVLLRISTKKLVLDAALIGTETGGMDTPISIDPDSGKPWRSRFDPKTLLIEERMLQAACYIVCAYLTGMRDAEVQAMRSGCLETRRSEDGVIERYRVKSTVYKRRDGRGQPETWTTIEPVAKAIRVLEQLTERIRKRRGGDTLWRVLDDGRSSKDHISAEIVRQLNAFRDHLNSQFGTPGAPIIPLGTDGEPWRITTRQFRRTIAWHIANRPFGTVAGMIQYKHASIAAYEGYAGSSRSGFHTEVERERALGQLDDVLSYFERHRAGEVLMGPGAVRISNQLQQAVDELDPLPGHIADPARIRAMLTHIAKTLFVGVMNDCFFDPATALCLNGKTEAATPAMAQCRPDRCPNSCVASHHRPLWAKAIDDGEELLKSKRLSPLQREVIESDLKRYRNVIRKTSISHQHVRLTNEVTRKQT